MGVPMTIVCSDVGQLLDGADRPLASVEGTFFQIGLNASPLQVTASDTK